VKLRASTFLVGVVNAAGGNAEARWQIGSYGIQVLAPGGMFWSKKALILRNAPYTINNPHPGQIEVRMQFGKIARAHKGEKGFKDGLPIIAWHIRNELKGFKAPDRMDPDAYPSKKRRTIHTLEELEVMLKAKRPARAPPAAPPARA
jgi:hypothetical protein